MKWPEDFINKIICGDCLEVMPNIPSDYIDLTVTSPPYDNLRTYKGYKFDFKGIAKELYRVTKEGGVVVWVVGDETINGSETGTSFRQALYFKGIGFNLHDTMIWQKDTFTAIGTLKYRYASIFEYMFVLAKGKLRIFNPLEDRLNKTYGRKISGTVRLVDGKTKRGSCIGNDIKQYGQRFNIWEIPSEKSIRIGHPAPFPEQLAKDHILSWSNKGNIVLDPMCGSGTTCKMAKENGRKYIGIDTSEEYCEIARKRVRAIPESLF